jgi:Uncharacterised protein family (UPF0158)
MQIKPMTPQQIKEIASELETGFDAFLNKSTGQCVFIVKEEDYEMDPSAFDKDIIAQYKAVYKHPDKYHQIPKWTSGDAFEFMADFVAQLPTGAAKIALSKALDKKGPFQNFRQCIQGFGGLQKQWLAFKTEQQEAFVCEAIALIDENEA